MLIPQPEDTWQTRFVMWGVRSGLWHVVLQARTLGIGVGTQTACSGGTIQGTLRADAYHLLRTLGDPRAGVEPKGSPCRFCRECLRRLEAAGHRGEIEGAKP